MSSQLELVRYGSTALATSALHRDMVISGRDELKRVYQKLPSGAEAVVRFLVVADLNLSAHAKRSHIEPQMYHAAAVHLATHAGNRLTVTATIGTYVTGHYQEKVSFQALKALSEFSSPNTVVVPADTSEVEVFRHPLISEQNEEHFHSMNASTRCPRAFALMEAVKKIFRDGVPLPFDQRFHYCTFTVMVRMPHKNIQYLTALRGLRGTRDPRSVQGNWTSTGVEHASGDEEKQPEELEERFRTLRAEACEGVRPLEIPAGAKQLTGKTRKGTTDALK